VCAMTKGQPLAIPMADGRPPGQHLLPGPGLPWVR
jgi:hypothetical protein